MSEQFTTRQEASKTPEKEVRRWLLEVRLAGKRQKDWEKEGVKILDKYRSKNKRKNSFNILWANTEILREAVYNSVPKPDVRRRFRQNDMLGKASSELLERSLSYATDAYDFDSCIKYAVLDALLPGRGVDRVRYVPSLKDAPPKPASEPESDQESAVETASEPQELDYEQALCEHVQWDDFRHGAGKTWDEVCWVGFRHRLTRDDLVEKFGEEVGKQIQLNDAQDDELSNTGKNADLGEIFKRAELWEIWDKDSKHVFFVNESYKKGLLFPIGFEGGKPPLSMKGFFPVPCPLRFVEDASSLIPVPVYELYREQAEELDRISTRINKIVNALKVRGVYDSTLSEMADLMQGEDNQLIPVEQAKAWMNNGGLEKAIWWMPTNIAAAVLKELYAARMLCKATIDELTGISDIVRGETNANETATAQNLKSKYASLRLQKMQREVQRYARDLIRLLGEVIGEKFNPETLKQMTGMNFFTGVQKQQLQLQASAMSAQQQPIPEDMQRALMGPTWEDVMGVLKSDMQREYRVDVETNSTVAETISQDMEGLREVLTSLVELWNGVGPAVERGALDMSAVKAISMTIVRRARMGLEVEDALESGMHDPKPQSDPNAAKAEAEKAKVQADAQLEQQRIAQEERAAQREAALEQQRLQMEEAARARELQMEAMFEKQKLDMEAARDAQQQMMDAAFERWKALLDAETKIEVAEISAGATLDAAQTKAAETAVQ